jgi:hypothetical protein
VKVPPVWWAPWECRLSTGRGDALRNAPPLPHYTGSASRPCWATAPCGRVRKPSATCMRPPVADTGFQLTPYSRARVDRICLRQPGGTRTRTAVASSACRWSIQLNLPTVATLCPMRGANMACALSGHHVGLLGFPDHYRPSIGAQLVAPKGETGWGFGSRTRQNRRWFAACLEYCALSVGPASHCHRGDAAPSMPIRANTGREARKPIPRRGLSFIRVSPDYSTVSSACPLGCCWDRTTRQAMVRNAAVRTGYRLTGLFPPFLRRFDPA